MTGREWIRLRLMVQRMRATLTPDPVSQELLGELNAIAMTLEAPDMLRRLDDRGRSELRARVHSIRERFEQWEIDRCKKDEPSDPSSSSAS